MTVDKHKAEGINTARAGYTYDIWGVEWRGGDHPRSRGVYPVIMSKCSENRGSSPLARGLPLRASEVLSTVGIIPARAGFTSPSSAAC